MTNSIPTKNLGFYDCGFDPRFSVSGTAYYDKVLKEKWKGKLHHLLLIFKAYLSPSSEKRRLFKAVLQCSKMEKSLASDDRKWCVLGRGDTRNHPLNEHDFLEASSKLSKLLLHNTPSSETVPERLFPCEILRPIHAINQPQNPSWNAENIKQRGGKNGDLNRLAPFGFYELSDDFVTNPDHKGFIEATEKPADELKLAMRNWRKLVHKSAYSNIASKNYIEWKQKLQASAAALEKAWENYETSHQVLHKVNQVFNQSDVYKKFYQHFGRNQKKQDRYLHEGAKIVKSKLFNK